MKKSNQAYAEANRLWLEQKAQEPEVRALGKGVYYTVINEGAPSSKHPAPNSIVVAHYTGRTIDGKTFDSSVGGAPLAIRLRELIPGWIMALQQMRIGDKWEIYLSAEMGYGRFAQPGIPGGSTLIFEIELLQIA